MDVQKPRRGLEAQFPDQASFKAVIDRFALSSVRVHDLYPSYIGPAGKSNIDYIFARRPQLDRLSRQARCIRSFPINMHRAYPDHNPISCTIPLNWKAWYSQPAMKCTRLSWNTTQNMRQVWKDHSTQWTTFEAELDSSLRQAVAGRTHPSSITDLVLRTCNDHFRKSPEPRDANWCLYSTRSLVALKWRHLHLARNAQLQPASQMSGVFRAWFHMTQHAKLRHRLRKHCQDLRKQRIQKIIQDATQAANRHDARRLYMAIRTLTPKQPRRQIRFRNAGVAQDPQAELNALMAHFEAIFCATSSDVPPLTSLELPFTQEDLERELRATKIDKAVAPGTVPPLIIKHFASHLSHWLYRFLEVEWGSAHPTIPAAWKNASLSLLAKRTVHSPNDLRPIALTCGLGKAVLGTLVKCAHTFMADSLVRFPLFAYTEKRGVLEALCFVFDHCHQVRQSCNQAKPSHWQKQAGHCIPPLTGGMMLSLDLTQAFDRLPRSLLCEGLLTCGCPQSVALLLVNWLQDAKYCLSHRGLASEITTTCGVRQGCRGSPLEWNVFMTEILRALSRELDVEIEQLIHRLICFADDLLLRWTFHCRDQVHHALIEVGRTLDVLEAHHLLYNPKKTVLLLRLEGSQAVKVMKHCAIKTKDGLFVRIPRRSGETWLPLVHTHTYLGCKISYHCFEKQTLQYRMQIGTTAFQRLRPWLAKRHSVSTYTRAQVWKSCILSSYLHGLAAAGVTQEGFHKLIHKCHAQLRLLGQSPGHITHETNADLFNRLALTDPAVYIQDQWTQLYHRLARQQAHFSRHDFMRHLPLDAIRSRVLSVFEHVQVQPQVWTLPCPYCPQLFDSMTHLNRHLVITHKITRHKQPFLPVRDAQQGRPQCRHCHYKFYDWRGLKRHIVSNSCPLYTPDLPAQVPPADRPIFREHAQAGAWLALIEDVSLVQILREHCVLCGQYFFTGKSLLEHLNHHHYEMWSESKTLAPIINDALRDSKPCQACGKSIVKAHACHVVRQMAIIHALHTSNRSAEDTVQGKPVAPTPPKPDPAWQIPESGLRVKAQPSTAQSFKIINTYHPGRDSADGTSTCAHCQCVQGNHFALRRHIESGCCRAFNALRPLGKHIPQTWPELMSLARNADTAQILSTSTYTQALRTVCALCGRHCAKPGSLHQHLLQDHATIVHAAEARVMNMQTQANALGRPCYCGNRIVRKGHQCVIFAQIGLLQVVASKETSTASDVSNPDPAVQSGQVNHKDDPVLDFWVEPQHQMCTMPDSSKCCRCGAESSDQSRHVGCSCHRTVSIMPEPQT